MIAKTCAWLALVLLLGLVVEIAASRNFCTGWWSAATKTCTPIGAR